ncbi:MAG: EscU/YscU/HrcU family type III secretion system export apparatus switch protein [Chlamydiales bacterium]
MKENPYPPSPKKLRKAREKGEVPQSNDLVHAIVFLAAILLLWAFHSLFDRRLKKVFFNIFSNLTYTSFGPAFCRAFSPILWPLALILVSLFLLTIAGYFLQRGWVWTSNPLKPKRRKAKRELLPLVKVAVIACAGYLMLRLKKPTPRLIFSSPLQKWAILFKELFFLSLEIGIVLLLLGFIDFWYRREQFYQQRRMSRQEVEEEEKEESVKRDSLRKSN